MTNLSDQKLHAKLLQNMKNERVLLIEILHLLREVERRRLFCDFKCSSIFDYAVRILGYSEPQASRRIQAMRIMRDVPSVEEKLSNGELTLTTAAQVQQFIKKEENAEIAKHPERPRNKSRVTEEKKKALVEKVSGLSSRKTEQVLLDEAKEPRVHKEKVKPIGEKRVELKFSISTESHQKMQKLKGLLAHKKGSLNLESFFDETLSLALAQIETEKRLRVKETRTHEKNSQSKRRVTPSTTAPKSAKVPGSNETSEDLPNIVESTARSTKISIESGKRKAMPASIRREVWQKAQSKCENCGSEYALEIEHRKPVAKGGTNSGENLLLLCRKCNQRAAILEYGAPKMSSYLRSPQGFYKSF